MTADDKRVVLRFTIGDDLNLLKELVAVNPYTCDGDVQEKWGQIRRTLIQVSKKNFSLRAVKDRVTTLINLFRKQDRQNLRKSGTEEQYEEKENLLQSVKDLQDEFSKSKEVPASKRKHLHSAAVSGTLARNNALKAFYDEDLVAEPTTSSANADTSSQYCDELVARSEAEESGVFESSHSDSIPCITKVCSMATPTSLGSIPFSRKRKIGAVLSANHLKKQSLEYLAERSREDNILKNKELEFRERELKLKEDLLAFEKEKYELEKHERLNALLLENEERRRMATLLQTLIEKLT